MLCSSLEKNAFKKYQFVAGIDEVGRGPLAGPVVAAAVAIEDYKGLTFAGLQRLDLCNAFRDSKHLSPKQREEIFEAIKNNPEIKWKVSFVSPNVIDKINIWQATLLAWRRCLKKLSVQPDFLFLDGKFDLNGNYCNNAGLPRPFEFRRRRNSKGLAMTCFQQPIIKGDEKIFLVSLASIIAKVSRDRLMEKLDKKYPEYGFIYHKGYGTKLHLERLKKYGPCPIHRRSFRPVFDNLPFRDKVYYAEAKLNKSCFKKKKGYPKILR